MSLLQIDNLVVSVASHGQRWRVIDDLSLTIDSGETLGLVGESGCGKSLTALSILRLLPQPVLRIESGSIRFDGVDLLQLQPSHMQAMRGDRIAMIFQDPMTALNPVHTIGRQLEETLLLHRPHLKAAERRQRCIDLLQRVGMPAPAERLTVYPHQLSGGMRQRVTIAMALACEPALLIADEPTTALDVTVQAQVLALIKSLQREYGMAVLFITHDLGVIAETCERVAIMYAGRIAEMARVRDLFSQPSHPYTRALLASLPALAKPQTPLPAIAGQVPAVDQRPAGCPFANRCSWRVTECDNRPPLFAVGDEHDSACFRWPEVRNAQAIGAMP